MRTVFLFLIFFSLASLAQSPDPSELEEPKEQEGPIVELFSPQGTVKNVRQATARFSEAMVHFGDPRTQAPFDADCPMQGAGHWVDARNWVFDFEQDLPAGIRCSFRLKTGIKALSGAPLTGRNRFFLDTGGPSVLTSLPGDGAGSVDENPVFILKLDSPVRPESVTANVRCEMEGVAERIEANVLQGEERGRLLAGPIRRNNRYFFEDAQDERLLVLQCRRSFPPETKIRLVWGSGILSTHGIASEQDQVLSFKTRSAFSATFSCQKVNAKSHCIPFLPMTLSFSAPISTPLAQAVQLLDAHGKAYPADNLDSTKAPSVETLSFKGPFPEQSSFKILLPAGLADDAGRPLENAGNFPLTVQTDEYPPLAKFNGQFGIIEWKEGGILPVTLRNLEAAVAAKRAEPAGIPGKMSKKDQSDKAIGEWLRKVEAADNERYEQIEPSVEGEDTQYRNLTGTESVFGAGDKAEGFDLPKPHGAKEFEVVGIPLTAPGFYVVELASPRLGLALLGEERPRYVATSALVTNLSVHFKWGRESSLVWVTSLDKARPVADAEVRISDFCTGEEYWHGRTDKDGMARVTGAKTLPEVDTGQSCFQGSSTHPLFVSARTGEDMSFVVSGWNKGIQPDDFKLTVGNESETKLAHAVFDRSLFRAGETVSMKIFLRKRGAEGFAAYGEDKPDAVEIRHGGSDEKYRLPVSFDDHGIAEASWVIPKEAKLGAYDLSLQKGENRAADIGAIQVEQFRIPTMKAVIQPSAEYLVNAKEAKLDLFVGYLSGGGASSLPVKLRSQVRSRTVDFADYEDFSFGGGDVKEGVVENVDRFSERETEEETASPAQVLPLTLDKTGAARASIPNLPKLDSPKELLTELEYQDANGQRLTVSRAIPLHPARLYLGLKQEGWFADKDQLRFQVLAVDPAGKPMKGQDVKVELFRKTTYSYRKRLIGGFYDYENKVEYRKLDQTCENSSNREGIVSCELKPGISGNLVLRAVAKDEEGNIALNTKEVWTAGGEDWWFDNGPSDRMDLLPEKKSWEFGQSARLQVRMPFREATALVTVEREGVLDSFIVELSGKEPVIEVPIKPHYAPNVYISVLAVRPRVRDHMAWFRDMATKVGFQMADRSVTALVDLNKPAYKLGMAQLDVGWAPNKLAVKVQPEREVYKVREQAKLKVKVTRADGGPLPPDAEIALSAVDEGLLELKPNDSWKLLEAMMGKRGIEVYTATAQMQVVGKRHYGRKAVPHGGGGGKQNARELFDTLLLWKGRLPLDAQGEANIELPLNDSLTSFRLAAVANAGWGYFGTGEGSIRTTQDIMLHSGLPPLVRENDAFKAVFTLRNASNRKLSLIAKARWSTPVPAAAKPASPAPAGESMDKNQAAADPAKPSPLPAAPEWKELAPLSIDLDAGEARELAWDVVAPLDASKLLWEVEADAADGSAHDKVKLSQDLIPVYPVRVYQATLAQIDKPFAMSVERPQGAITGRGGVRVSLRAKLGDGLGGVLEYMGRYPYSCMEQRVSKAVSLRSREQWDAAMKALPAFIDDDGLVKYFATENLHGSDVLTSYLLAISHEAAWEIPPQSLPRLQEGLKNFIAGKLRRNFALATADLAIRKLAAIEALSRYGEAKAEMLESLQIEPNLWPTSAVLDWISLLKRMDSVPQRADRLKQAEGIIRSRLNLQGTTLGFSSEDSDRLWWLMVSIDENAVRALRVLLDLPTWREDVPRLVRGALGRQNHGHWDTTTANAWGTLAMEKFSAAFEAVPVAGYTEAELAGVKKGMQWTETTRQSALNFPWSEGPSNLAVKHQGQGKPWAIIQSRAALPLQQPLFTGYRIRRSIEPIEQKQTGVWSRGDVARIKLELEAQADMTWVVVDDPVPAGASILGSGLGGDSRLLTAGERSEGQVWPAFEERRFEAFRAYYEYVPKGAWSFEYTVRLNNPGRFELPATRVEALYAPEMFGELPNGIWEIRADP
ncbi:MAG: MG2 domain-containing protein [Methylococcaceae bacterium]|nr:MG2 domain-containing protein [Methylococcaceae bacterium]